MEYSNLLSHFNENVFLHVEFLLKEMQEIKIELNVTKKKLNIAEKEIIKLNSQGPRSELNFFFIKKRSIFIISFSSFFFSFFFHKQR